MIPIEPNPFAFRHNLPRSRVLSNRIWAMGMLGGAGDCQDRPSR